MNAEQQNWIRLRDQAQGFLPADFARKVVHRAQKRNHTVRREHVLIAATAAACLLSVAVANWYWGNLVQDRNLTQWRTVGAQVRALRKAI